ncbi:hypothetical protein AAY473_029739 [Plecturocebus cupreus]
MSEGIAQALVSVPQASGIRRSSTRQAAWSQQGQASSPPWLRLVPPWSATSRPCSMGMGLACECHLQGSLNTECGLLCGSIPAIFTSLIILGTTVSLESRLLASGCSDEPSGPVGMRLEASCLLSLHGLIALLLYTERH